MVKNPTSCPLFESSFHSHNSKQFSLLCKFGDEIDKIWSFYDFIKVDDVGMSHSFHDFDLSLNANLVVFILDWFFINDLYCHLLARRYMYTLLDLSKGTTTQCFSHFVITYPFWNIFLSLDLLNFSDFCLLGLRPCFHTKIIINLSEIGISRINDHSYQMSHNGRSIRVQGVCYNSKIFSDICLTSLKQRQSLYISS